MVPIAEPPTETVLPTLVPSDSVTVPAVRDAEHVLGRHLVGGDRDGQAAAVEVGLVVGDGGGHFRRACVVEQHRRAALGEGRGVAVEVGDDRRRVVEEAEVERVVGVVAGAGRRLGVVGERDRLAEGRLAGDARAVVVVVDVGRRGSGGSGDGDRGNLQAEQRGVAAGVEIVLVDAHDVVAGRQPGEGVVAAAVGQDAGDERRTPGCRARCRCRRRRTARA